MPGQEVKLGPFNGGLHNGSGTGEYINTNELFQLDNLTVDVDGSLMNRPAIKSLSVVGFGKDGIYIIGTYTTDAHTVYLVVGYTDGSSVKNVGLVDTASLTKAYSKAVSSLCSVQYKSNVYIVPEPATTAVGGYFKDDGTWTAVSAMPKGQSAAVYNERVWIAAGPNSVTNTSRIYYSDIADPTSWPGSNYFDIEPGDGQNITCILVLGDDLIIFKEHSTYRLGYSSSVDKAQISKINSQIGAIGPTAVALYSDNSIYVLHDTTVYEMFNFAFNPISTKLRMSDSGSLSIRSGDTKALSLYKNMLFVRVYDDLYVYYILTKTWSRWKSSKVFSYVSQVEESSGAVAYASGSLTASNPAGLYKFTEDRLSGIGSDETFDCQITTKTYDFDTSWAFKVMFWWGMTIATMQPTKVNVNIPSIKPNSTWQDWANNYTSWQDLANHGVVWSTSGTVSISTQRETGAGGYARKFYKYNKKVRFRQAYFTVSTSVSSNAVGDAAVRIYELTAFLLRKETVVGSVT